MEQIPPDTDTIEGLLNDPLEDGIRLRDILNRALRSSLVQEAGWSFGLRATSTGLGFITTVLLARLLGAEGYGIYAYAYAFAILLAMPAQAGLPHLVIRETARGLAQARPDRVRGVWQWAVRIVGGFSVITVLVGGVIIILWQGGWRSRQGQTMIWALILVPLIVQGNLRGAALRGLKHMVAGLLPEFVLRPGLFLLLVGIATLLITNWSTEPFSASLAMALHTGAALAAFLIGIWLLRRYTPPAVRHAPATIDTTGWLTSSILFALISGFAMINNQTSTVILGIFQSPDQVGVYRVAVQVAALASFGLQAANLVVAPRFAKLYTQGDMNRLQWLVTKSAQVVLGFNIVLTLFFVLLGQPLFSWIFGIEFVSSYTPLLILLVGQMVDSAAGSVGYLLNMTGHERETVRGMAIAAGLNILLNLLLVPTWGIVGAALATATTMIVWNALLWWRVHQRLGINSLAFHIQLGKTQ